MAMDDDDDSGGYDNGGDSSSISDDSGGGSSDSSSYTVYDDSTDTDDYDYGGSNGDSNYGSAGGGASSVHHRHHHHHHTAPASRRSIKDQQNDAIGCLVVIAVLVVVGEIIEHFALLVELVLLVLVAVILLAFTVDCLAWCVDAILTRRRGLAWPDWHDPRFSIVPAKFRVWRYSRKPLLSWTPYQHACAKSFMASGWVVFEHQYNALRTEAGRYDCVFRKGGWVVVALLIDSRSPVDSDAVFDIQAARHMRRADQAIIIARNGFTARALEHGRILRVGLIRRA